MAKMARIDRDNIRIVNTRVLDALKVLGEELGVTFTTEKLKFSNGPTGFLQLNFVCADAEGEAQTSDKITFERGSYLFGLKPTDYLAKFRYKGDLYEIYGLRPRAPSYPIKARLVSDPTRMVNFPAATVTALLTQLRSAQAA